MSQNFDIKKQRAIEEMLKMQKESNQNTKTEQPSPPKNSLFDSIDLPILNRLKNDSDLTLVLGLMLLLLNENADKRLLFALLYILL